MVACVKPLLFALLLGLASCAGDPPERSRPAPAPATGAPVISIHRPGTAPRRATVDDERIAELEARLREDPDRDAPPRATPRPPGDPDADLRGLDLEGLAGALDGALDQAQAAAPPGPAADEPALREADRALAALARRLHAIASRLLDRRDATLRELERRHAAEDAPLAEEEERLARRSVGVVVGGGQAYVDDPAEQIEAVQAERRELLAEHEARVGELQAVYRPLTEDAARGRARVGEVRREVLRRLAAGDEAR